MKKQTLLQRTQEKLAAETPEQTPAPAAPETPKVRAFLCKSLRNRWLCPNGHTLGVVLTEKQGGQKVPRLIKFPFAFDDNEYVPENLIVSKIDAGEIGCTKCGAARVWKLGKSVV